MPASISKKIRKNLTPSTECFFD